MPSFLFSMASDADPVVNIVDPQPSTSRPQLDDSIRSSAGPESDDCSICQDVVTSETKCCLLPCEHNFHQRCISQWFATIGRPKTCPNCRRAARKMRYNFISDSEFTERSLVIRAGRRNAPRQVVLQPITNGSFAFVPNNGADGRNAVWQQGNQQFTPVEVAITEDISIYGMHPVPVVELISRQSEIILVRRATRDRLEAIIAVIPVSQVFVLGMDHLISPHEYLIRENGTDHQLSESVAIFSAGWRNACRQRQPVATISRTIPTRAVTRPAPPGTIPIPTADSSMESPLARLERDYRYAATTAAVAMGQNIRRPVNVIVDTEPTRPAAASRTSAAASRRPVAPRRRRPQTVSSTTSSSRHSSSSSASSSASIRRRGRVARRPGIRQRVAGGRCAAGRGRGTRQAVRRPRPAIRRQRRTRTYTDFMYGVRHPVLAARRQRGRQSGPNRNGRVQRDRNYDPRRDH